jgi:hypothetical protein
VFNGILVWCCLEGTDIEIILLELPRQQDEDKDNLVCAAVRCRARILVRAQQLLVVMTYKCPINSITNLNPISSH